MSDIDASEEHDVLKMVGIYKKLFLSLVLITLLGIGVAFMHLPVWVAVVIGLTIMIVKSTVVIESFKHLLVGRWAIILIFTLTVMFVIPLVLLPLMTREGSLVGTVETSKALEAEQLPAGHHGGGHEEKQEEHKSEATGGH